MRGIITIRVRKRNPDSRHRKDNFVVLDNVKLINKKLVDGSEVFITASKYYSNVDTIRRNEISFMSWIYTRYGSGDYNIQVFGKGKEKGFRRFADMIISNDRKFFRRKESNYSKDTPSFGEIESFAMNTESFISRYMKTMRPGIWYQF